jgi:hypothetical protein
MNPQSEILAHYLRGESLTVLEALRLYHSTELRRINSRINAELLPEGKMIVGEFEPGQNYKRYWLVKTTQIRMVI